MDTIKIIHEIPSGPIPVEFAIEELHSSAVPVSKSLTSAACLTCAAYGNNWGCPPYAPTFSKICGEKTLVICAKVMVHDFPARVLASHRGIQMKFCETWLKPLTDRFASALAADEHGKYLSSGCCRVCAKCQKKLGKPCAKPELRTNSMESTGVLVSDLVKTLFGFPLQWWSNGSRPDYTCKVVCVTY